MERSSNVNLKTIADKLTTEMTGSLNYVVRDDIQYFSNSIRDGGEKYVPVVINLEREFVSGNTYFNEQTYTLRFHVLDNERDTFVSDILDFIDNQLAEIIDGDYVKKIYQGLRITGDTVLNGVDYFVYELEAIWSFSKTITGAYSEILFDSTPIPFVNCRIEHDIAYVSSESRKSNYRMTNDTVTISIPLILSNEKVLEIYNEVNSDYYNKVYSVTINDVVKSLALKKSVVEVTNDSSLVSMILTLETSYPRVAITLDGEVIPVTAYRYNGKKVMDVAGRNGQNLVKGYSTGKTRSWSITLVKDASTLYSKVVADAYGEDLGITYTLLRDGETFTLELADVVEAYTETGDMSLECQFMDYGN